MRGNFPDQHDIACRSLRLGSYGLTIDGPIGHAWYKFLDKYVYPNDPQCTAAVLIKTAADQIAWAPIMTCVYFAFLRTLEGHPELIVSTIQVYVCLCEIFVNSKIGRPRPHMIFLHYLCCMQLFAGITKRACLVITSC